MELPEPAREACQKTAWVVVARTRGAPQGVASASRRGVWTWRRGGEGGLRRLEGIEEFVAAFHL